MGSYQWVRLVAGSALLGVSVLASVTAATSIHGPVNPPGDDREDSQSAHLPAKALVRLQPLAARKQGSGPPPSAQFVGDADTVVTAMHDAAKIVFWDARTGKQIRTVNGARYVAVALGGRQAALRSTVREPIRLQSLVTGKETCRFAGGEGARSFVFSRDGRYLAIGGGSQKSRDDDPPLRIWNTANCELVREIPFRRMVNTLAFSPNAAILAFSPYIENPPRIQLWELASGKRLGHLEYEGGNGVFAVAFSPSGQWLAVGGRPMASIWDVTSQKIRWRAYDPRGAGACLAFSKNEEALAVGTDDGSIRLLEAATGKQRARLDGDGKVVGSVAFSPCDLALVSASDDDSFLVWDVTGVIRAQRAATPPATPIDADALWRDLCREDAAKAWQAICALARCPAQGVPIVKRRLTAYREFKAEAKIFERIARGLNSDDFDTREGATRQLAAFGSAALPHLRQFIAAAPSAEAKRRAVSLRDQITKGRLVSEDVRDRRILEILEYAGTPAAKELLHAEAVGGSSLSGKARAALKRLAARRLSP